MYVCIYIFSDLLRKRDSLLRDFSLKKGSIPGYKGAWDRFQKFYEEVFGTKVSFPVPVEAVSLHLTNLGLQSKSSSVINTASASITFEHEIRGFQTPCTKPMITRLKKAIKRKNAGTKVSMARRPFTIEEGDRIRGLCIGKRKTQNDKWGRLLALFSIAEALGLRIGEARTLRVGDVDLSYSPTAAMTRGVFLKDSKTDKFSTGTSRGSLVRDDGGRGQNAFQNLCDYLGIRRWGPKDDFIFKDEEDIKNEEEAISYSTVRTDLLTACELLGIDLKNIGWHGVRKMAGAQEEERVGGDLSKVASFLGHSEGTRSTLEYMCHLVPRDTAEQKGGRNPEAHRVNKGMFVFVVWKRMGGYWYLALLGIELTQFAKRGLDP